MTTRKSSTDRFVRAIIEARRPLARLALPRSTVNPEEEGGCGVTGFASSVKVKGRHIFEPSRQMHNRGNGKGGGIAALGLDHNDLGVSAEIVTEDYLLQIAFLDMNCRRAVEDKYVNPYFRIDHIDSLTPVDDYHDVEGLEIRPPDVVRYFIRVKKPVLQDFIMKKGLRFTDDRKAEDEFVYQNTFRLNSEFYAGGEQRAFVLSHGRNLIVLKAVGYAEQVVQYYQLDNLKAHAWIAHQRFPTKGRVWHPGGAHPFVGLNEALVHNGDFANYQSIVDYLRQRNIFPLFMTDTEVSAYLFDLLTRVYSYPLEYVIEALAPTSEMDLDQLSEDKQRIYSLVQNSHMHGSPDGPWFFIIARNNVEDQTLQLIGITDTSMLRPQVFALMDGEVKVGLICSEKHAIDATLRSLADEDPRFGRVADTYWNARGGSHTDGGAFIFNIKPGKNGEAELTCTDKFGQAINIPEYQKPCPFPRPHGVTRSEVISRMEQMLAAGDAVGLYKMVVADLSEPGYERFLGTVEWLKRAAIRDDQTKSTVLKILTLLLDRRYDPHDKRRRSLLEVLNQAIDDILLACPLVGSESSSRYARIDFTNRDRLGPPQGEQEILVIDAFDFKPEGCDCDARLQVEAYRLGWRRFICFRYRGQRFTATGLGLGTDEVRFDIYGGSGDYLASGIDGLHIYVHGNAQDQLCQIMKNGKLVIYGDVGQTFMYGAKGGEAYIMGNTAGRPLINGVGRPRVVINGTSLDYLAESFMAGDPLKGGGFAILNGVTFDWQGRLKELPTPYPGSNLFSLASGGAIYIRDPHDKIVEEQLNGGILDFITLEDWELIRPYLKENERLFGISLEKDLLTVDNHLLDPGRIYRKVKAVKSTILAGSEESLVPE
ncbi:MAG: glutamate synthase [Deltaproteobacteria bacterium]|nr:glutamate synthase [Deltaproteobacteria bacterium]MBW2321928.1 glutamate synthase [Deltaproteobacteria bacterium]